MIWGKFLIAITKVARIMNRILVVHQPAYGEIECIDLILDKGCDFPLGNAVKYIVRAGHKRSDNMSITDKQIEDLKKAKKYIDFEIEHLEGKR